MMTSIFYFLMLAFLLTHELDAVMRKEWRLLPILSRISDEQAERIFILAHVPLIALAFILGANDPTESLARAISIFAILHVVLHWVFRNHPKNEFNNIWSQSLIVGAGFCGAIHLGIAM